LKLLPSFEPDADFLKNIPRDNKTPPFSGVVRNFGGGGGEGL